MSKRRRSKRLEQASLDGLDLDEELAELPLRRTPGAPEPSTGRHTSEASVPSGEPAGSSCAGGDNLELFDAESGVPVDRERSAASAPAGDLEDTESVTWARPSLPERVLGGLADFTVHIGVLAGALLAMSTLELIPAPRQWPGFLVFLLCFSFLYHVVPLAFWGQTPGMAWRGIRARDAGGDSLSFGQSGVRWAGAVMTGVLGGLPILLALVGGRSLSDRISGSRTLRRAD